MPSGVVHDKINKRYSPLAFIIILLITRSLMLSLIAFIAYLFACRMFSGDLDIISVETVRWGIFAFIWRPYRMIFKHRSIFTHCYIVGTVVRLFYLSLWMYIFYNLFAFLPIIDLDFLSIGTYYEIIKSFILNNKNLCFSIFLGLELGSSLHTTSDLFYSRKKRKQRQKKNLK